MCLQPVFKRSRKQSKRSGRCLRGADACGRHGGDCRGGDCAEAARARRAADGGEVEPVLEARDAGSGRGKKAASARRWCGKGECARGGADGGVGASSILLALAIIVITRPFQLTVIRFFIRMLSGKELQQQLLRIKYLVGATSFWRIFYLSPRKEARACKEAISYGSHSSWATVAAVTDENLSDDVIHYINPSLRLNKA
ncbi:hypothetical protein GGX14DRAFT_393462 [Mycena pura]|uniref:Uncharacterized protein n=1 Tax=Mycena pura TaxID=153505 RepID=A0AAD6VIJ2_9AGAR|nr:hypothetical protein GGX14DRAFT_393462 [Mycena pura]